MIRRLIAMLRGNRDGTLSVELAFAMPMLVGLLLTGVEFTRYVMIVQKVERTSATIADLVAQSYTLSEAGIANLLSASGHVMEPFDIAAEGNIVVSSISAAGGAPATINWQRAHGGGSGGSSAFGAEGETANLPAGFTVQDGDSVIVCEAYFDYEPFLLQDILGARTVYRFAVFRPRFTSLTSIAP